MVSKLKNAQNASLVAYRRSCKPNPMHPSAASPNKQANYDVVQAITIKVEIPSNQQSPLHYLHFSLTSNFTEVKESPQRLRIMLFRNIPNYNLSPSNLWNLPPKARPQIVRNTNLWILWYPFWPNNFSEGPAVVKGNAWDSSASNFMDGGGCDPCKEDSQRGLLCQAFLYPFSSFSTVPQFLWIISNSVKCEDTQVSNYKINTLGHFSRSPPFLASLRPLRPRLPFLGATATGSMISA